MQNELEATYPLLNIQLAAVNEVGHESGNGLATEGRDLPFLQDVDANQNGISDVAYDQWNVVYRDVVILDGDNVKSGVYNLTEHNLADPANATVLRNMLLDAAMANQKPWHNWNQPMDCDVDGVVAPHDALVVINTINREGARQLPPPTGTVLPQYRYDSSGDGFAAPGDVLQIINYINAHGSSGEGEAASGDGFDDPLFSLHSVARVEFRTANDDEGPAHADLPMAALIPSMSSSVAAPTNGGISNHLEFTRHARIDDSDVDADDSFWDEDWLVEPR